MNGPAPTLALPAPARPRAVAAARRHSAAVRVLRVAIPAGAAVAIGLVALASTYKPFGDVPGLTLGSLSLSGSKIAMESPRLTGFRKDDRPYEVTADVAYQDVRRPNVIELKAMKAKLAVDDRGGTAHLQANGGLLDTGKDHLELRDAVRVWTDKGEEALLRSASVDLKAGSLSSREPVKLTTPTMVLDAGAMDLADGGRTLAFTGRVRVELTQAGDALLRGAPPAAAAVPPAVAAAPPAVAPPPPALAKATEPRKPELKKSEPARPEPAVAEGPKPAAAPRRPAPTRLSDAAPPGDRR